MPKPCSTGTMIRGSGLLFALVGLLTTTTTTIGTRLVVESFSFMWNTRTNNHHHFSLRRKLKNKNRKIITNNNVQQYNHQHNSHYATRRVSLPFLHRQRPNNEIILFQSTMTVPFEPEQIQQYLYEQQSEKGDEELKERTKVQSTTDTPSSPIVSNADEEILLQNKLIEWFQGDFDNYNQVVQDRKDGYVPKEGGGHEHIHCTLVPLDNNNNYYYNNNAKTTISSRTGLKKLASRLAAFYFDGVPKFIFRFRYYELVATTPNTVDTILYTLHPELEQQLRIHSTEPTLWPYIFHNFQPQTQPNTTSSTNGNQTIANNIITDDYTTDDVRIRILPGCDVRWSFKLDPIQHLYAIEYNADQQENKPVQTSSINQEDSEISTTMYTNSTNDGTNGIHAVMVYGEALVDSQMKPGSKILIQDQISIWENQLWIHDRGFDPFTGNFIYGNQRNIPYALDRVANFIPTNTSTSPPAPKPSLSGNQQDELLVRQVVNDELAWTMGTEYRSNERYDERIQNMGGPSINIPMSNSKNNVPKS